VVSEIILSANASAVLGVDAPLDLQKINPHLLEIVIDGCVLQHGPNGGMSGRWGCDEHDEKKRANDWMFHSDMMPLIEA
jgi:hypothetical protein